MAIRGFDVGQLKGLRRAAASNLGNLVVLAGPNGAGKSSLLDRLRQERHTYLEPGTRLMYVGPHRTWRSSNINKVSLYGWGPSTYGSLLEADSLPNFQYGAPGGLQAVVGQPRESSGADDAQAFVKTSLGRLKDRQESLVTAAWESNGGTVSAGEVADVFAPFRRLISTLLPHLEWAGVNDANPDLIEVLFQAYGGEGQRFDIDQLSSGEKAAIALLLPLVELQADDLIEARHKEDAIVPITMLLDEPELHLHPLLQLQVLQYLRDLASRDEAQFILTTHSPTLLDALREDELYLLSPASLAEDNQLSRLTTSQERLEVARELTGSTHVLTRAKPIVFIEGEEERPGVSSDTRLISNLLPVTASWALVPSKSKIEVGTAVSRLRQAGLELPGAPVFGLVDADSDNAQNDSRVISWPVAMIENLLLSAPAIVAVLSQFGGQTNGSSLAIVSKALAAAASEREADEVRLRVQRQLPVGRLSLKPDDVADAEAVANEQMQKWLGRLRDLDVASLTHAAKAEVDEIIRAELQLQRFHGKRILHSVYEKLGVSGAGLSKPAFAILLSKSSECRESAAAIAADSLDRIRLYLPPDLDPALAQVQDSAQARDIRSRFNEHMIALQKGQGKSEGRAQLRQDCFSLARTLAEPQRTNLVVLASEIGTA